QHSTKPSCGRTERERLAENLMKTHSKILALIGAAVLLTGCDTTANDTAKGEVDASVKAWMQVMDDRVAVHDLLVTYGRLLDEKDLAGYSKLFATDGVWEGGIGSAQG